MRIRLLSLLVHLLLLAAASREAFGQRMLTARPPVTAHPSGAQRGDGPPNDDCTGAVPHALAPGQTVTFSGDNTGATMGDEPPIVDVFEAFTLSTCATVTIDYCSPGSVFHNFFIIVGRDCATLYDENILGHDDTCSVTFIGLPAGTYYVPVMVQEGQTPIGAYTFTASAVACVDYCEAHALDAGQEIISSVTFGGVMNFTGNHVGYDDQTATVMEAEAGGTSTIIIALSNGQADDVSMVWIDLDGDGQLAIWERMFTSEAGPGPHTGTITLPANATPGYTRMRIRMENAGGGMNVEACGESGVGQVMDHTLLIALPTGMEERGTQQARVFPNPTHGGLTIVPGGAGMADVSVMDLAGHELYRTRQAGPRLEMDLTGKVAPGTYVLRCVTGTARSEHRIVVY